MQMYQQKDEAHIKAMSTMTELMKSPDLMQKWFDSKRKEFDLLKDV